MQKTLLHEVARARAKETSRTHANGAGSPAQICDRVVPLGLNLVCGASTAGSRCPVHALPATFGVRSAHLRDEHADNNAEESNGKEPECLVPEPPELPARHHQRTVYPNGASDSPSIEGRIFSPTPR